MTGQNTEKQILTMVLLLLIAVGSLGAYTWYDNGRRTEAESEVLERDAERGAHVFARNCRVCHGNDGRGRESDSTLVGPALNTPTNTYAWRTGNQGQWDILRNRYEGTIRCGRNGTAMPPWATEEGGSLNSFQIDNLVTLITTNAGNGWEVAEHSAHEEDELSISNLKTGLTDARAQLDAGGWDGDVEAAGAAVAEAEASDGELSALRGALERAQAALEGAEDAEAAQAAADEARAALDELEREYTKFVLDVVAVRTGADEEIAGPARTRLAAAGGAALAVAEARAWLRAAGGAADAESALASAEERFAADLPIDQPAAQVTAETCGQVHDWSDPGFRAAVDELAAWLSRTGPGGG